MKARLMLAATVAVVGCGDDDDARPKAQPGELAYEAEAWPEADALFRADPAWLGGDAAYSVALGGERVLWLFGDSFIATSSAGVRSESRLVRNSVAVQTGLDPTTATMAFHWDDSGAEPESYLAEQGDEWFWPLHGIRTGEVLTLFFLREAPSNGGLGFESVGWNAFRVADPDASPSEWVLEPLAAPDSPFTVAVGTSLIELEDYVYVYAVQEPGSHDVYLARWRRDDFVAGDLLGMQWHDGELGFVPHDTLADSPEPVMRHAQTELSVSWDQDTSRFVQVQSVGFGATTIGLRLAEGLEGPWSELEDVFRPPESDRPDAFVYAGKAHPGLAGTDLAVTYAANAWDFATLISDDSLYWPRFVKLTRAR